jgi:hypothetical protein
MYGIILLLPHELLLTAFRINTAGWLLESSTVKQTITFRYEVPQTMSKLNENQSYKVPP